MRVEEVRREVHTAVPTVHIRLLNDTFIILIACTDTIRHVLQTTRDRQVVTRGDSSTEDFVLPVSVGCAERFENVSTAELGHQGTVLVTAEHIVALLRMRDGHIGIVVDLRSLTGLTFLCGDDDDTVRCT